MIEIKSLKHLASEKLYETFKEAFSDYEIQISKTELARMLVRRGFSPELSFGAFDKGRLVSFTFNGLGIYNGKKTTYDTGTGTIPEYMGQGIAGQVFEYAEKELKKANVDQYLLEVLQHNTPAVKLYTKLGFQISREFNYFSQETELVTINTKNPDIHNNVRSISINSIENLEYNDYSPSWQNSIESIKRSPDHFENFGFFNNDTIIGFIVTDPKTGDITQIAVHSEHRRKGIGTTLFSRALEINNYNSVKVVNSDTRDKGITSFLESLNIPLRGKQYEMIKQI